MKRDLQPSPLTPTLLALTALLGHGDKLPRQCLPQASQAFRPQAYGLKNWLKAAHGPKARPELAHSALMTHTRGYFCVRWYSTIPSFFIPALNSPQLFHTGASNLLYLQATVPPEQGRNTNYFYLPHSLADT